VVGATHEARAAEVSSAEELIADHARRFWRWYRAREAAPVIRGLRAHAEAIRREEVERLLAGLDGLGDGDRRRIEASMRRMLNKLLHPSTVAVRRAALDPGGLGFLEGLRNALGLAPVPLDEAVAPGGVPAPEDGHGVAAETREEREAGNR
jgi:glutamyl-tRNA reductase